MSQITVELIVPKHLWERPRIILRHDIYVLGQKVPAGFNSDMATTPRPLWSLFPPWGKWILSSIAHDYLVKQPTGRDYADRFFLDALIEHDKVHPAVAHLMYWAVCIRTQYLKARRIKVW